MSYPKPLSTKSLQRLYKESGLSEEKLAFLHNLFKACANLYGAISLRSLWEVYKELEGVPKIKRKDLISLSSIVRREVQPYYVFEVDELFDVSDYYYRENELDRHIVSRDLIGYGYGKLARFNILMRELDRREGIPYAIPDNFIAYASPEKTKDETALFDFLANLVATAEECVPKYGQPVPNEHKGKKLNEFSFLNSNERFDIEYFSKRPAMVASLLEEIKGTEAEKILRSIKQFDNIGSMNPKEIIDYVLDELTEVGVQLERNQLEELFDRIMSFNNNSRLWCLYGWSPSELAQAVREHRL